METVRRLKLVKPSDEVLVSIDPGAHSGLAVHIGTKLVYAGRVKSKSTAPAPKVEELFRGLQAAGVSRENATAISCVRFVVEAQYLGAGSGPKANPGGMFRAVSSVCECAASWETIAKLLGLQVEKRIYAQSWQSTFGIKGRTKDRKRASKHLVNTHLKQSADRPHGLRKPIVDADTCDAILLGLHCAISQDPDNPRGVEWVQALKPKPRRKNAKSKQS